MDIAKVMDPGSAGSYCVSRTTMGRCEGFTEHYVSACDLIITRSSALLLGNSELIGRNISEKCSPRIGGPRQAPFTLFPRGLHVQGAHRLRRS